MFDKVLMYQFQGSYKTALSIYRYMTSTLSRVDYAQIGTTNYKCLHVIQRSTAADEKEKRGKKQKSIVEGYDKVVVGAQSGVLLCIERKNAETNIVYKTLPGTPISSVQLGGALHSLQNKTFIATRTEVKGFSIKGKQFLEFESNIAEGISLMYIYGVDMFLCSRNTLYHFHDCVEKNSYTCVDTITDVLCLPVKEGGWVGRGITPVLACSDKSIKVVEGSRLAYEVHLRETPNLIHLYMNDGGPDKQLILYGTKNGLVGLLNLDVDHGDIIWEIDTQSFSSVTAICCFPILETNSAPDLVFGKEDGLIEVYSIVENNEAPLFREQYQCEESITGLACGRVNSPIFGEIIVCTYTGWIFALTTEPLFPEQIAAGTSSNSVEQTPQVEIKVQQLRLELERLEKQVFDERTRFQEVTKEDANALAIASSITLRDRFALQKENSCYRLTIELTVPIDYVLLQSDVKVDLMDVEKNSAVISITEPESESGNSLLAVYRCQVDMMRMEMRIRSIEGQFGMLRLYVVPKSLPLTCKVRSYPIKPLALHERIHAVEDSHLTNVLTLTGQFSMVEAHSWLVQCVPQVPERCPQQESITFNFRSTFNGGTMLQATYGKGRAVYKSDNLSTIVILRDVITKIITIHQLKVHISCDIDQESIVRTLELIHPKIEFQSNLRKKLELAKGIKELEATFGDTSYLNKELKDILNQYDELQKEATNQSMNFDRVLGIITDLYIDKFKMNGIDVKHKANELVMLLQDDYTFSNLINFFKTK